MAGKQTKKNKQGTKKTEQVDTRKAAVQKLKPQDAAKVAGGYFFGTYPYGGTQGGSGVGGG